MTNPTPEQKLEAITKALNNGQTVYVNTELKSTKITSNNYKKWVAKGIEMFKATEKSLYIRAGKKFVCIDFASLKASN